MKKQSINILFITSNQEDAIIINDISGKSDFCVIWCDDALSAINEVNRTVFDTIIIDNDLPATDGIDLAQKIQIINNHIPILFISSKKNNEIITRCYENNICDVILRPLVKAEILQKIQYFASKTNSQDAIEQKYTEQLLNENDELLTLIAHTTNDAIIILNHEYRISFWNKAAENIFGYKMVEVIGSDFHEMIVTNLVWDDYKDSFESLNNTELGTSIRRTVEIAGKHKNEILIDLEMAVSSIRLNGNYHSICILKDNSKQKRIEANLMALSVSAVKFLELSTETELCDYIAETIHSQIKNSIVLFYILDNENHKLMLKQLVGDVDSKYYNELVKIIHQNPNKKDIYLDDNLRYILTFGNLIDVKDIFVDIHNKNLSFMQTSELQEIFRIENVHSLGIVSRGVLYGGIFIITPNENNLKNNNFIEPFIQQSAIALQRLYMEKQLSYARKQNIENEAASNAKSEFFASISHEIRTPMNAIVGFTYLLDSLLKDEKQKSFLQTIKTSSISLLRLINDVLDISKIESGKIDIKPIALNVSDLIEDIKANYNLQLAEKNIYFSTSIDKNIPETIFLDEIRIRQVILNVVGNAFKFTERGSIDLKVTLLKQNIENKTIDLQIKITDTGIGIAEDQQEKIFEPFKQQDNQDERKFKGTGLGLAITRRLLDIMNGSISVESKLGKGSIFTIQLNDVNIKEKLKHENAKPIEIEDFNFEDSTILVIDDVKTNRDLIVELFKKTKVKVILAENGISGVHQAKTIKPDLIFMDLLMPSMNGFQANAMLRKMPETMNIPVIAVTAFSETNLADHLAKLGFKGLLRKPLKIDDLLATVVQFLKHEPVKQEKMSYVEPQKAINYFSPEEVVVSPEIMNTLENHITKLWEKAIQDNLSNDIEILGKELVDFGNLHQIDLLINFGKQIQFSIESFDLEKIDNALKAFPDLINKLRPKS